MIPESVVFMLARVPWSVLASLNRAVSTSPWQPLPECSDNPRDFMSDRKQHILVPVSTGELVDKVTILRIKSRQLRDAAKLANVTVELTALEQVAAAAGIALDSPDARELEAINEKLWQIEDDIREQERQKLFGPEFIALARAVYITNDKRFILKSRINAATGSSLREEKSYKEY